MSVAVKICGIKTPEMAIYCAKAGVQFVGLVFCEKSPRFVDTKTARLIADAAKQENIIPVAVFSDANENTIMNICNEVGITYVQLHGDLSRDAAASLPNKWHKIYVNPIQIPDFLRPEQDYLLLDSPKGGSGEAMDWHTIKTPHTMRFFLAGGLNVNNVVQAISIVHPFAVDVSSGVESSPGQKSEALITQFITKVKHA